MVEQPKPAPPKPSAPLPRVAQGLSASQLAVRGPKSSTEPTGALVAPTAISEACAEAASHKGAPYRVSMEADDSGSELAAVLREQVLALQEQLQVAQTSRVALERSIREEVAMEMREHLEAQEAEMQQRLELERYQTEDMYLKKLALVRGTIDKRAETASVQAHTDMLQQTRDNERREAEHAEQARARPPLPSPSSPAAAVASPRKRPCSPSALLCADARARPTPFVADAPCEGRARAVPVAAGEHERRARRSQGGE